MKRTLTACCASHFLVDFACAFLLFRTLYGAERWTELLIVYNFFAFAVQMPLGVAADHWKKDGVLASAGALVVAAAYGVPAHPLLTAVLAGLGNAAFHVGGGLETLSLSGKQAGLLGLFVSPGAVGLFLGTALGKGTAAPLWLPPVLLAVAAAGLYAFRCPRADSGGEHTFRTGDLLPLCLLLAVVVLRSYVGMSLAFPWKGEGAWGFILVLALAGGKALGGCLADRTGMLRTAACSLLLSAGLFLLAELPVCGTLAVLLFNITMPLTLWAAAVLLPRMGGLAFGLLTFGLFLGFLPVAFGAPALSGREAALLAAASLLLLLPGLGKAVRR